MRSVNKKQLYRLEHSFLDSVLKEGFVLKSSELEEEGEFNVRFRFALKHTKAGSPNRIKELVHGNVTVNMLIDTTAMPAEKTRPEAGNHLPR